MTVAVVPYVEQNLSHSAALFRQAFAAGFASGGTCATGELAVAAQSSPNMTVQVAAGRAIVPGTNVSPPAGFAFTTQGSYFCLNDATISVTISTANATNPRIDVVYIAVQDAFYSGASNTALISVATGTPAPSPAVPAIPTNAIALAQVAVAANASSIVNANITNVAAVALAFGIQLDARTGATRSQTPGIRGGNVAGTTSAGGDITVTFAAPFPNAIWSALVIDTNTTGGIGIVDWKQESKSVSGFVVRAYNASGTVLTAFATSFDYIAIGA